MNTYTIQDLNNNFELVFNKHNEETVLLNQDTGDKFIVLPFSEDKWQDIFLKLYHTFEQMHINEILPQKQFKSLRGIMKGKMSSVDEFIANKQKEKELENV